MYPHHVLDRQEKLHIVEISDLFRPRPSQLRADSAIMSFHREQSIHVVDSFANIHEYPNYFKSLSDFDLLGFVAELRNDAPLGALEVVQQGFWTYPKKESLFPYSLQYCRLTTIPITS